MRVQMNVRSSIIVGLAAFMAAATSLSCYESPQSFQPIATGAKPWTPPAGWDPEPPCVTGYYVAIDSCPGCTGVSYALCSGVTFSQCVCGGPFWPGVQCAKSLVCCPNDFPPYNWLELKGYAGPGWAGLSPNAATRTCSAGDGGVPDSGMDASSGNDGPSADIPAMGGADAGNDASVPEGSDAAPDGEGGDSTPDAPDNASD